MKCCQRQIGHHLRVLLLLISEIVAPLIVPGGRGVVLPKQNSSLTRVSQGLSIQRGWWGKKPRDCKKLVRAQTLDASQTGKVRDSWEISRHLAGTQILAVDCLWVDAKTYHWDGYSKGLLGKISVFTLWGFFCSGSSSRVKEQCFAERRKNLGPKIPNVFFSWNQQYLQRISKQNYVGVQGLVGPWAS